MFRVLAILLALLAVGSQAQLLDNCKNSYATAVGNAADSNERCLALVDLAKCFVANMTAMSHVERLNAQGFFDAAKLNSACGGFNIPVVNIAGVADDEHVFVKVPRSADVNLFRQRETEALSIWDISDKFAAISSSVIKRADFEAVRQSVVDLQTDNAAGMNKVRDEILEIVDARLSTLTSQIKSSVDATFASVKAITSSLSDIAGGRLDKVESGLKDVTGNLRADVYKAISIETNNIRSMLVNATNATNTLYGVVGDFDGPVVGIMNKTLGNVKGNVDKLISTFTKTAVMNPKIPVFRYNVWSTYSQAQNWMTNDNSAFFGGVAPSTWTDGSGYAYQMSSDKNVLRTLFHSRMYPGSNALVSANEWYSYSSTNGMVTGALFRIRNTLLTTVTWRTFFYFSAYNSWGEMASVAMNGINQWTYSGSCGGSCNVFVDLIVPANRVSTVIFITTSGAPSSTRTNLLAFYNDCLNLPNGLEYVDDLDWATGGWEA